MNRQNEIDSLNNTFVRAVKNFKPPERLTVSQWAEKNRRLSPESSAEAGPWRNERTPYLVDIMDAFTDPKVNKLTVVAASQVGKSEVELNIIGYIIDQDPGSTIYVQPTLDDARKFSRLRIAPMIRDSKPLRKKVSDVKTRDSGNTILQKSFPGGMLTITGSNSPSALASTPARYIIGDERDRWASSAGTEGDPWALAEARQTTFYNAKSIEVSTPTIKGAQIIEPLLQMRRYTEGELMAALVESFFTAFVTTDTGADEMPFNEVNGSEIEPSDPDDYEMGPGTINVMKPGEDIKFAAPTRPASGFSAFIRALCEQCGAALEIPADLLLKSFNASYSASRAALLEAWKAFKMRREWFANDFCKPIYEIWLSEAVALGRIQAPGFFSDPLIRAAWLGSDWIGPSQGQLDPTKEISAEILANQHGYSTHEQSTIRLNGGQWEANMNQLKRENEMIAEANGTTPEAQAEATQAIASLILQNSLKEDQQHAKADNPAASS